MRKVRVPMKILDKTCITISHGFMVKIEHWGQGGQSERMGWVIVVMIVDRRCGESCCRIGGSQADRWMGSIDREKRMLVMTGYQIWGSDGGWGSGR